MSRVMAAEWLKVRRRRLPWILLALVPLVMAVLYALLFVGMASAEQSPEDAAAWDARLSLPNVVTFGDAMVYRLVALFCVILAGSITANEFTWRTILTFATWTGDRRALLAGKLAVTGAVGAAFIAAAWASVLTAVVAGNLANGTWTADTLSPALAVELVLASIVTWAAAVVYAAVAAALAVWTRSSAAAIAIPLGVLILEPLGAAGLVALGGLAELAANFTLSYNIDGLLSSNGGIDGTGEDLSGYPPAWRAASLLATFVAVTLTLTMRTLSRRDIRE